MLQPGWAAVAAATPELDLGRGRRFWGLFLLAWAVLGTLFALSPRLFPWIAS